MSSSQWPQIKAWPDKSVTKQVSATSDEEGQAPLYSTLQSISYNFEVNHGWIYIVERPK